MLLLLNRIITSEEWRVVGSSSDGLAEELKVQWKELAGGYASTWQLIIIVSCFEAPITSLCLFAHTGATLGRMYILN